MLSAKQKDTAIWLFLKGCHADFIATVVKREENVVRETLQMIFMGKEEFVPGWANSAFDDTDWTQREEWILRTMRKHGRAAQDVADLLGRSVDSVKKHFKEMKQRDEWLHEYARKRQLELKPKDHSGGLQPKTMKQAGFGF